MALNLLPKPGPGAGVHRVSRGGSSLCLSPGDCEAAREGTGTLRSPEDSGSAPARLCRHGRAAPPASLLPHLHRAGGDSTGARRGSTLNPPGTRSQGLSLAQARALPVAAQPARRAVCRTVPAAPTPARRGTDPTAQARAGGSGGKGGTRLSQSQAGCLFKRWRGARRGLFICRECWLPAPRRRKRIQRNKAGPPGEALGRGRDGHGPACPPQHTAGCTHCREDPHPPSSHRHPQPRRCPPPVGTLWSAHGETHG